MKDDEINTENLYKVTITHIFNKREHKTSAILWSDSEKTIENMVKKNFSVRKIEFEKILSGQITFLPKEQKETD